MKKFVLLAVLVAAMPLTTMAQDDDLYFNPKQEAKKEAALREQRAKAYAEYVPFVIVFMLFIGRAVHVPLTNTIVMVEY